MVFDLKDYHRCFMKIHGALEFVFFSGEVYVWKYIEKCQFIHKKKNRKNMWFLWQGVCWGVWIYTSALFCHKRRKNPKYVEMRMRICMCVCLLILSWTGLEVCVGVVCSWIFDPKPKLRLDDEGWITIEIVGNANVRDI